MRLPITVLILALLGATLHAEPTTQPLPEGTVLTEIGGRRIISVEADLPWIKSVVSSLEPTTRPTTMPSDVLGRIDLLTPKIAEGLRKDLALDHARPATQPASKPTTSPTTTPTTNPITPEQLLTDRIKPVLQQLNDVRPNVTYVVLTKPQLLKAVKTGWGEPQLHYNRLADDVAVAMDLNLTLERLGPDVLVPVIYLDKDSPEQRAEKVRRALRGVETGFLNAVARRCGLTVESHILNFIANQVVLPLNLPREREWFGIGVIDVIAGKYASQLLGIERDRWMQAATLDVPRAPVRFSHIDLNHPSDPKDLRREYFPYYVDAMRRKSALAMWKYAKLNGDEAVTKLLIRAIDNDPTLPAELEKITELANTP